MEPRLSGRSGHMASVGLGSLTPALLRKSKQQPWGVGGGRAPCRLVGEGLLGTLRAKFGHFPPTGRVSGADPGRTTQVRGPSCYINLKPSLSHSEARQEGRGSRAGRYGRPQSAGPPAVVEQGGPVLWGPGEEGPDEMQRTSWRRQP